MNNINPNNSPFLRALRYLARMEQIYNGSDCYYPNTAYFDDDIYSFFITCFHVRDWLINDENIKLKEKTVDDFIDQHEALKICCDLCNGIKHFELTRKTRTGSQPRIKEQTIQVTVYPKGQTLTPSGAIYQAKYTVSATYGKRDALLLARECINLWKTYLKEKGINI